MTAEPGPPPRLVASDIDGTLIRSDGTVSARTVEVISRVEQAGVPFVLVSGRPPRWMHEVAEALDHHGLAVCANGALVYDLHTERVVHEEPLDPATLREVVSALQAEVPEVRFAVEYGISRAQEAGYRSDWPSEVVEAAELSEMLAQPAAKLLARHPRMTPDEFLALARKLVGDRVMLTHSSTSALLEISAQGVTKATGLANLAEERGITGDEVVAFGDMPNDLPLLAWAGRSYAVANAHPEVIEAADEVVPANDEDGVAQVLERWF